MLWWIVDRAMIFYLLLGMLGCGLAICWWQTRRGRYLAAFGAVAGLALLLYLLTVFVITDRQRLPMIIDEMAEGILRGNPDLVFKHFAKDLKIGNYNREEFEKRAGDTIRKGGVTELRLWDFNIEELSRADRKARLVYRVRADSRWENFVATCRAYFVLEGNDWKMQNLEVTPGISDKNQPITIPLP